MRAWALSALIILGAIPTQRALAWSADGHEYIGAIADQLLNDHARQQVVSVLGFSLQTASTWPDCVRSVHHSRGGDFRFIQDPRHPEYTAACASFETPAEIARMEDYAARNWNNCAYEPGHGCHESYHFTDVAEMHGRYDRRFVGTNDHDVVSAINAAVLVLQGKPAPSPFSIKDGKEALFMIAHFVGDLHQPLHVGALYLTPDGEEVDPDSPGADDPEKSSTHGGNSILDSSRNLHAEWDAIPRGLGRVPTQAVVETARQEALSQAALADLAAAWATDTVVQSHVAFSGIAFSGMGNHPPYHWQAGFADRSGYVRQKDDLQAAQLVKGGAHLAELLNRIWP